MLTAKNVLFLSMGVLAAIFVAVWVTATRHRVAAAPGSPDPASGLPRFPHLFIGFVSEFLDTLGIGSFATTTSFYKIFQLVRDELIPGTLNVGIAIPTVVQALIYITIVEMDMTTLVLMIGASVAGAWLGAGVVASWPRRNVQIGMGVALLVAAGLMLMTQLDLFPRGGDTLDLSATRL